jgi:hypothetical protein
MGLGHSAAKAETRVPISHWIWPILTSSSHSSVSKKNKKISKTFFNPAHQLPGPGPPQAFLVVSGCVRDYPIDLVNFIRSARLNPLQVAAFLGEDFPMTPQPPRPPQHIHKKEHK